MKVPRTVKHERRREMCLMFAIKFGDQARRPGEAQLWSPAARINHGQAQRFIGPRIIQIEMQSDRRMIHQEDLRRFNQFPNPAPSPVRFGENFSRLGINGKPRTDCNLAYAHSSGGGRAR
jgi:hypothetical protein